MASWKDDRGECIKDKDENGEEYNERATLWGRWPNLKTNKQAQWLRCAIITNRTLQYLQTCHTQGLNLKGTSPGGNSYAFIPQNFYEYLWICLSQGLGRRQWKKQPPMPSEHMQNKGIWFESNANRLVKGTVSKWEHGSDIGSIIPILTWDDLLPSPQIQEAKSLIKAKTKPFLKQVGHDRKILGRNSLTIRKSRRLAGRKRISLFHGLRVLFKMRLMIHYRQSIATIIYI